MNRLLRRPPGSQSYPGGTRRAWRKLAEGPTAVVRGAGPQPEHACQPAQRRHPGGAGARAQGRGARAAAGDSAQLTSRARGIASAGIRLAVLLAPRCWLCRGSLGVVVHGIGRKCLPLQRRAVPGILQRATRDPLTRSSPPSRAPSGRESRSRGGPDSQEPMCPGHVLDSGTRWGRACGTARGRDLIVLLRDDEERVLEGHVRPNLLVEDL